MISVEKAKKLILKNTAALNSAIISLDNSLGSVAAGNIVSPIDLPLFDQSAMDGFAIVFSDYVNKSRIKIVGEVAAGNSFNGRLNPGQAVRIFTGAPIPSGGDTVVMQEKVIVDNDNLIINDPSLVYSANVRKTGSQIKKGKTALTKDTIITPGGIGYLAAMGVTSVNVIPSPKITVIVTGSELKKPGKPLIKGEIYESNSYTLQAVLQSIGLKVHNITSIRDSQAKTFNVIRKAIRNSDLVLITGGISVGKYDFVGSALTELGVKNIFYKINQKPGKPLFFGKKSNTLIFGLPGNPAAVLSCFYEYVYPAINIMRGKKDAFLRKIQLPIAASYPKKPGLSFFLKGRISDKSVVPLEGQESYILSSFASADCLIYLSADRENIQAGEMVEVHILPGLY
jgi:molybdopterin molybdotransferase